MLSGAAVGLAAITYPRALKPLYHVAPAAETSKTGARRISFHSEQVSSNSIITYSRPQVFELIHGAAFGAARRQAGLTGQPLAGSAQAGGYFFRRAAFAPSLPSAVRVFAGRCATVRFRFAAAAAFFTLRRAAVRCF